MIEWMQSFLVSEFMPHGHCFFWLPELLWLTVISDAVTAISYFVIPFFIYEFYKRRPDMVKGELALLFAAFIFFCGVTHLIQIWNIWKASYWLAGVAKLLTGLASAITVFWIVKNRSLLYRLPSTDELKLEIRKNQDALKLLYEQKEAAEELFSYKKRELEAARAQLAADKKNLDLMQKLSIDRELRMLELKKEVNGLCHSQNSKPKYDV